MTFEEIDARYRAAALSGDQERWDDTEEAAPDEAAEADGGSA